MSSPTNNDYLKWCQMLKIELKEKSKINVEQRINVINKVVNNVAFNFMADLNKIRFCISNEDKIQIIKEIENKIETWRGVEIEVCKNKRKKNFQSYQATARNWFNRNKAKIYGNYLFFPIIYNNILKYCVKIPNITSKEKITLFIEIFECILLEPVQFPRTKLQPLLPHQTLMQPNKFKKASQQFINFYNIKWIILNNRRDRDRAKKIHNSFMNCLIKIKKKKTISTLPYPFHLTNTNMSTDTNESINNINNITNNINSINSKAKVNENKYCYSNQFDENDYYDQCYYNDVCIYDTGCYNANNNFIHFNNSFQSQPHQQLQQETQTQMQTHSLSSLEYCYTPSRHGYQCSQARYSPTSYYDQNCYYNDDDNNSFLFSNISSPTPLLGGFL